MLRFASLEEDGELLYMARELGDEWLKTEPETALRHAKRWFAGREGFLEA